MIDVRQLAQFLAVIEHGSVGRAAAALNITQPALSKSIKGLEEMLQVPLFDRGPTGMTPTVFGRTLEERARFITLELRNTLNEMDALRDVHRGSVVVGGGPSIVGDLLARATARLTARRPEIRVSVVEGLMDTLLDGLERGALDFTIGTQPDDEVPDGMHFESLFRDEVAVMARNGHPVHAANPGSLADLRAYPWVLTRKPDPLRHRLERLFDDAGTPLPEPNLTSNSARFLKTVAIDGDYLTFLPRLLTQVEEDAGLLRPVSVPGARWHRMVHIARRERGTVPPAARALIAVIRQVCLETGAPYLKIEER